MVDIKVLAAVLVSLAAFGIVSDGGVQGLEFPSNPLSEGLGGIDDMGPRSLGAFLGIVERDTSREELSAEFSYNSTQSQSINFQAKSLEVKGLNELKLEKGKISSRKSIIFYNTTVKASFSPSTVVEGESVSLMTNGVNLTGPHKFNEEIQSRETVAEDVQSEEITLNQVKGKISSVSTSSTIEKETDVSMTGFHGDIGIAPYNGTIELEGTVTSLEAGKVNID